MYFFKRLAILVLTLAITSFASDKIVRNHFQTPQSEMFHKLGNDLFQKGCGEKIEEGYVIDASLCLAAIERLSSAVELNPSLAEDHVKLARLFLYKPNALNLNENNQKYNEIGLKHTIKALEYLPENEQAKKLFAEFKKTIHL